MIGLSGCDVPHMFRAKKARESSRRNQFTGDVANIGVTSVAPLEADLEGG